jgi:hypothetical protein
MPRQDRARPRSKALPLPERVDDAIGIDVAGKTTFDAFALSQREGVSLLGHGRSRRCHARRGTSGNPLINFVLEVTDGTTAVGVQHEALWEETLAFKIAKLAVANADLGLSVTWS